jgi:hypothetical protein
MKRCDQNKYYIACLELNADPMELIFTFDASRSYRMVDGAVLLWGRDAGARREVTPKKSEPQHTERRARKAE